jgi:hypothetical protein
VGTLVTLELPGDSPVLSMPWIITFAPAEEGDEDWEPVVCGPYERDHALALAEEIVADEELTAVVEPLLPLVEVDRIREEIAVARALADEEDDTDRDTDLEVDYDDEDDEDEDVEGDEEDDEDYDDEDEEGDEDEEDEEDEDEHVHAGPPSPEEIRAGFARIAARLAAG